MLVLSRFEGQRVLLRCPDGREVWITVTKIERGKVKLGLDADPEIIIMREELLEG